MTPSAATPPLALDAATFPLLGRQLIEASAGTGKTYTIANLYIRLVLGHGQSMRPPLSPDQILVVTFTKAAAQELVERIRLRLNDVAIALRDDTPPADPFMAVLWQDYQATAQRPYAARLLTQAAEAMDEAAISTIHSWCQRMLREHALDSGSLFSLTLDSPTQTEQRLLEATCDFWREHAYALSPEAFNAHPLSDLGAPDNQSKTGLLSALRPWLTHISQGKLTGQAETPCPPDEFAAALAAFKAPYSEHIDTAKAILDEAKAQKAFNGTAYRHDSAVARLAWIAAWVANPTVYTLVNNKKAPLTADDYKYFDPAFMRGEDGKKRWLNPQDPRIDAPCFTTLLALPDTLARSLPPQKWAWLGYAASEVSRRVQADKTRAAVMGFDDMLTQLRTALQHPERGERLANLLAQQYPVALIDEFQDTDSTQFGIFDCIYPPSRAATHALVMIGDPKQAIYSFRGGDLDTYLAARASAAQPAYTLGCNYRATAAMVAAANTLFDHPQSFCHPQLPFFPVAAKGEVKGAVRSWVRAGERQPPLVMAQPSENTGAPLASALLYAEFARQTAETIRAYLQEGKAGHSGFYCEENGDFAPVKPSDIAVLVRTGKEAKVIQRALQKCAVPSVYFSDRESVFASPEAQDVRRWLLAALHPQQEQGIRAALSSRATGYSFAELDALNHQPAQWDAIVDRFVGYHTVWRDKGVLPMLRRLLHDFAVPSRLLSDAAGGGERALTNLLHLSELLQTAAETVDGEQGLVRWLEAAIAGQSMVGDEGLVRLESDETRVKIVTVHSAKGLEYPLVFLPFGCAFREADAPPAVVEYQDPDTHAWQTAPATPVWRLRPATAKDSPAPHPDWVRHEYARLQEDRRLLYVALTRACYQVWLGVAPTKIGNSSQDHTAHSALGSLLEEAVNMAAEPLPAAPPALSELSDPAALPLPYWAQVVTATEERLAEALAAIQPPALPPVTLPPPPAAAPRPEPVAARTMTVNPAPSPAWWMANYSALMQAGRYGDSGLETTEEKLLAEEKWGRDPSALAAEAQDDAPPAPLPPATLADAGQVFATFPAGRLFGVFLHSVFEWMGRTGFAECAADPTLLHTELAKRCRYEGWEAHLEPLNTALQGWLRQPLVLLGATTPPTLQALSCYQPEMSFLLATASVKMAEIDALSDACFPSYPKKLPLPAHRLNGMLSGIADLMFLWEGQYYVLDYKSNALPDYTSAALHAEMRSRRRYDLQALIYLLALHRHLQSRLPDYDYDQHMGGAVYVFVRGWDGAGQGECVCKPPRAVMDTLDRLLTVGSPAQQGLQLEESV